MELNEKIECCLYDTNVKDDLQKLYTHIYDIQMIYKKYFSNRSYQKRLMKSKGEINQYKLIF